MTPAPDPVVGEQGRSLGRDARSAVAAMGAARVTGALGGILTARLLGPSDKGTYAVLFLLGLIIGNLLTVGLEFWVAREVVASDRSGHVWGLVRRHLLVVSALTTVVGAALGAVAVAAGWAEAPEMAALLALVLGTAWFVLFQAFALGRGMMRPFITANMVGGGIYLAGVALLLATDRASVPLVLLAAAAGKWIPLWNLRKAIPTSRDDVTAATHLSVVRGAAPGGVGTLLESATWRLDVFVLAALGTTVEVGLYTSAVALSEVLFLVPTAVAHVLLPHIARQPDPTATAAAVRSSVLVTALAGAVLIVVATPLTEVLFGEDFAGAAAAVPALVAAAVCMCVWKLLTSDLLARGRAATRARTALVGLLTMLALDVLLIPPLGIRGAALAAAGGYAVAAVQAARDWRRTTGASLVSLVAFRPADVTSVVRSALGVLGPKPAPAGDVP